MSTFETLQNPTQASGNLTFDESKFKLRSRRILGQPEIPSMIKFLVTRGVVKTENQAVAVTLVVCILIIVATVLIFKTSGVQPAIISPTL